jgi:hypothetical protein
MDLPPPWSRGLPGANLAHRQHGVVGGYTTRELPDFLLSLTNTTLLGKNEIAADPLCAAQNMSPTVFREDEYRFFSFSREEERMHVHVIAGDGEAKFRLQPEIELAKTHRYSRRQMSSLALGTNTSTVEAANISAHGLWLLAHRKELFMSQEAFPWFKDQTVKSIVNVEEQSLGHFYRPDLDVDLIAKNQEKHRCASESSPQVSKKIYLLT